MFINSLQLYHYDDIICFSQTSLESSIAENTLKLDCYSLKFVVSIKFLLVFLVSISTFVVFLPNLGIQECAE